MDIELMKSHKKEIEAYCRTNGLSVEKTFSASRCWHKNWEALQHFDPAMSFGGGLSGGGCAVPAPIMLEMYLEDDKLHFKQTEHTFRLLADKPAVAAVAFDREPATAGFKRKSAAMAAVV